MAGLLRPEHEPHTNCQISLGVGAWSAGSAAFRLVFAHDDANDTECDDVRRLSSIIDARIPRPRLGRYVMLAEDPGRKRVILEFGEDDRLIFNHAYCRVAGPVRVRYSAIHVPCPCKRFQSKPNPVTCIWVRP
jgi:hypothetical protein